MRIIQFKNMIARDESRNCRLKNCDVVIDGQNFFYGTYEKAGLNFIYGCDSDALAAGIKNQVSMFKRANVKCYIVLKGGDSDIEKKIKKFSHVELDALDADREFVTPVLLKRSLMNALQDLGLRHEFCVTEVKDDCIALARRLQCPIISFDIEYCFRKAAYIPSSTIKFDSTTNSIQCRQFKLDEFLQKYSLTESKTALFATLCDENIFPSGFFETLFNFWDVNSKYLITKYKNLIVWLSRHPEDRARNEISKALTNEEDKNKFWSNYQKILRDMQRVEGGYTTEYLLNPNNLTIVRQDPEWFEKGVILKHVPVNYVNLYKWGVIEGTKVPEDSSRDLLLLSIDIVKYAYNLLKNYSEEQFKLYQDADNYIEIDSGDTTVRMPNYECLVSVFENGWDGVKTLKLFEHFLNENHIDTAELGRVPDDAAILLITLAFYARKKQMENIDVTAEVYARLLSYVIINVVVNKSSYKMQKYNLIEKDCLEARQVTSQYFVTSYEENGRIFDRQAVLRLLELDYCLQQMNDLNTLCGRPFEPACWIKMHNGTFIYKVYYESREQNCEEFLNKLLQKAPSVLSFLKKLIQAYESMK
uniref:Asteroid domain-containing protein n=1 Tax=Heliothis virescens TaxID=7102 RepID=A0A2A4KA30_HELVI